VASSADPLHKAGEVLVLTLYDRLPVIDENKVVAAGTHFVER
jgi:hypothetical protein